MPVLKCPFEDYANGPLKCKQNLKTRPGAQHFNNDRITSLLYDVYSEGDCCLLDAIFPLKDGMPYKYGDTCVHHLEFPSIKEMLHALYDTTVVYTGGFVYVIGGSIQLGGDATTVVQAVKMEQPDRLHWKYVHPLKTPRMSHGSVGLADGIVTAGGWNFSATALRSAERYFSSEGIWKEIPNMKLTRTHFGICYIHPNVFVLGGYCENGSYLSSIETYNIIANQWTELQRLIPVPLACLAATTDGRNVYIMGGRTSANSGYLSEVYLFDPQMQLWYVHSKLNKERAFHSACFLNKNLVVIGGSHHDTTSRSVLVEYYDDSVKKWIAIGETERSYLSLQAATVIKD